MVCNNTWEGIQRCKEAIQEWLKDMGLALQDAKTRYAHTLEEKEECHGNVGVDFLNCTIRQFPVGKYKAKKLYKTIIQPSKPSMARHWKALVESIDRMKAATLDDVIRMLHPKIAGWWAYCKTEVSSHAVQRLGKKEALQEKCRLGGAALLPTRRQEHTRQRRRGSPDTEVAQKHTGQTTRDATQRSESV